jgi:hypothetical protein
MICSKKATQEANHAKNRYPNGNQQQIAQTVYQSYWSIFFFRKNYNYPTDAAIKKEVELAFRGRNMGI